MFPNPHAAGAEFIMADVRFNPPVEILFGKAGRVRNVKSIREATECLDKWPSRRGPMCEMAAKALVGARAGQVTANEAREAFSDAALEARILVPRDMPH
jgi:hypothetical protein